jgi:hypothetical protein
MNVREITQLGPSPVPQGCKDNQKLIASEQYFGGKYYLLFPSLKEEAHLRKEEKSLHQLKGAFSSLNCLTFSQCTILKPQSKE